MSITNLIYGRQTTGICKGINYPILKMSPFKFSVYVVTVLSFLQFIYFWELGPPFGKFARFCRKVHSNRAIAVLAAIVRKPK